MAATSPLHGGVYFSTPAYTAYSGTNCRGTRILQALVSRATRSPGPGYRDVDITLAKSFGLPNMRVLGEGAKFEFRMDAFNLFNNLNFNPTSISNNIANSNFGAGSVGSGWPRRHVVGALQLLSFLTQHPLRRTQILECAFFIGIISTSGGFEAGSFHALGFLVLHESVPDESGARIFGTMTW